MVVIFPGAELASRLQRSGPIDMRQRRHKYTARGIIVNPRWRAKIRF